MTGEKAYRAGGRAGWLAGGGADRRIGWREGKNGDDGLQAAIEGVGRGVGVGRRAGRRCGGGVEEGRSGGRGGGRSGRGMKREEVQTGR